MKTSAGVIISRGVSNILGQMTTEHYNYSRMSSVNHQCKCLSLSVKLPPFLYGKIAYIYGVHITDRLFRPNKRNGVAADEVWCAVPDNQPNDNDDGGLMGSFEAQTSKKVVVAYKKRRFLKLDRCYIQMHTHTHTCRKCRRPGRSKRDCR